LEDLLPARARRREVKLPKGGYLDAFYGPHTVGGNGSFLTELELLQPRVALTLDPNPDDIAAFRRVCPRTVQFGRIYVPDSEMDERIRKDPEGAAAFAHDRVLKHPARKQIDYWQVANEILQFWDGLPLINRFFLRWMQLLDSTGDKGTVFAWSVGQPDMPPNDRMALWRVVYPACEYAEKHGHIGLVHGYGAPDLDGPAEKGGAAWLFHRLESQVLPLLPFKKLKFVYGETGADGLLLNGLGRSANTADSVVVGTGVRTEPKDMYAASTGTRGTTGPKGWQGFMSPEEYVRQLIAKGQWLEQFSDRVLGRCIFLLGNSHPWESYNIGGKVLHDLAVHYSSVNPPKPEVPPVNTAHPIEVIDGDGSSHDLAWLQQNYGAGIRVLYAEPPCFQLVKIMIDVSDNVSLNLWVQQENGQPQVGQPCTYSYPAPGQSDPTVRSSPDLPAIPASVKSRWCATGVQNKNLTDGSGFVSFQIGSSSWISNGRGPYAVWVMSPSVASDCFDGAGWKALTNHHGPTQLVFRYVPAAVVTPPVQPPSGYTGPWPSAEPYPMLVGDLQDKARWHVENATRVLKSGDVTSATALLEDLVRKDGKGLMYRAENAVKQHKENG